MNKKIKTEVRVIQQNIHGMNGLRVETFANLTDLIHAGNELIIKTMEDKSLSIGTIDGMVDGIKLLQLLFEEIRDKTNE